MNFSLVCTTYYIQSSSKSLGYVNYISNNLVNERGNIPRRGPATCSGSTTVRLNQKEQMFLLIIPILCLELAINITLLFL
jgi:hypothetical protein